MATTDTLHPGVYVRRDCLDPNGLSITDAAYVVNVSRQSLSTILSGRTGISSEMAIRLEKVFGIPADLWMRRQMEYDLSKARANYFNIQVRSLNERPDQQPKLL